MLSLNNIFVLRQLNNRDKYSINNSLIQRLFINKLYIS